jgi:hypothetical protein
MSFLLIFHEICSSVLVNQDNRKANRGSNGLGNQTPTTMVGLMNQCPTRLSNVEAQLFYLIRALYLTFNSIRIKA